MENEYVYALPQELERITFSDQDSIEVFLDALRPNDCARDFPTLMVISGTGPNQGKSTLARHLLNKRFGTCEAVVSERVWTEEEMSKMLSIAADRGYLYIELGHEVLKKRLMSTVLAIWSHSQKWHYRRMGSHELVAKDVTKTLVVLVGNNVSVCSNLIRRTRFINLGPLAKKVTKKKGTK